MYRTSFMSRVMPLILVGTVIFFAYDMRKNHQVLAKRIDQLAWNSSTTNSSFSPAVLESIDIMQEPQMLAAATSLDPWRSIQEKVKDTVVQVFSQIAEVDLIQPYKTPHQYSAYGTAFFINGDGELLTNAHVVNQAKAVWIQIPSLGKRTIDVEVVSVSPERDVALLRVKPDELAYIKKALGKVPFLELGDSDTIHRSDEVMALGYPLCQQSLKSTRGIISGREQNLLQIDVPLNPGNSGGPLIDATGKVVAINSASIIEAQNVNYSIQINDVKNILPDMYTTKLLRKPFLGILYNKANEALTEYLGNPQPGGCYVAEVVDGSILAQAGIQRQDMIYAINNNRLDVHGDMKVSWSEDRISLIDYVNRLSLGQEINFVVYRKGERKEITAHFNQMKLPGIHRIFPGYESIDYMVFAGMVIMPLTLNHIQQLGSIAPGLGRYADIKNQAEPKLVITHIFPNSQMYRSRMIPIGSTIHEINGMKVNTLDDLRQAIAKGAHEKFVTVRVSDNIMSSSEHIMAAIPLDKVLAEEHMLASDYRYPIPGVVKDLLVARSLESHIRMPESNIPAVAA